MGFDSAAYNYLYIYRIPVHSEFSWFHGIRLREPHDSIISGGHYYDSFAMAAQAYLNDRWKGQQPILIAHDEHFNELWRWEQRSDPVEPSEDLPF